MWTRSELKTRAREILNLNYWKAVLVSLIYSFLTGSGGGSAGSSSTATDQSGSYGGGSGILSNPSSEDLAFFFGMIIFILVFVLIVLAISFAMSAFIFAPLQVGCHRFFIRCENQTGEINDVVFAFSSHYMNVVKIMFFYTLYIFLWSLLFLIPGVIKSYEYRMIPYLLAENPALSKKEAFALSKQMMDGEKFNAWVLDLSFIGWNILSVFTCCILAIFYVAPYQNLTNAQLYAVLKQKINYNQSNPYNSYTQNTYDQNPYLQ